MANIINCESRVEWLKTIKSEDLTNRALMLASRLAYIIRKVNGEVIELQGEQMAMHIAEQVVIINDAMVCSLFRSFIEEVMATSGEDNSILSFINQQENVCSTTRYKN